MTGRTSRSVERERNVEAPITLHGVVTSQASPTLYVNVIVIVISSMCQQKFETVGDLIVVLCGCHRNLVLI